MSDADSGFALPPFKADEALQKLKRELRELGLTEREGRFERRGISMAKANVGTAAAGDPHCRTAAAAQLAQQCRRARFCGRSEKAIGAVE